MNDSIGIAVAALAVRPCGSMLPRFTSECEQYGGSDGIRICRLLRDRQAF